MTRWEQVEKLCQAALELEESRRAAFLEDACRGDEELRREVESLLQFDGRGDRFIEQPALEVAAKMIAQEKPESLIGQQLGSYQILSLLGAGGMGVVYKARDTRLNRSVAIKVLPADKVSDPERKRRFIQEARAASALNHPNIVTLYDIGSESSTDFILMEYVAGKTLDRLIPRKGMRLSEALKLGIQMADALAKAHSAGIIHRDLKPTNVMVTEDGVVKVLDFGVAKLTEVERAEDGTRTQSQTEEGMIIGTVSYMSPEQAEGKKVDARSDIFSFGAVLYEMISGQKAFQGDSKLSTLAAIVKQEPKAVSELLPSIPRDLEKVINRCLRKDPARRFQTMADLKVVVQELKDESDSGTLSGTAPLVRPAKSTWTLAAVALVVVAIAVASLLFRGSAKKPVKAFTVVPLTSYRGSEDCPSFSPDGNQVVFSWKAENQDNYDIYFKLVGAANAVRLTTDPADDFSPAFSPDGRWVGFIRTAKENEKRHVTFVLVPSIGGPERPVAADLPESVGSFAWFPDSKWVATSGLALLSTESGETRSLTSPPTGSFPDSTPAVSPDGRTVAFTRFVSFSVEQIYLLDLTEDLKPEGKPRQLTSSKDFSAYPVWTPDGQEIIFISGGFGNVGLWKIPASGAGDPEPLAFAQGQAWAPAVSRKGNRLAYAKGSSGMIDDDIWRLTLSGPGTAAGPPARFIASTRTDSAAQYSPDGKRVAFESESGGVRAIWVSDVAGTNMMEVFSRAGAVCGTAHWSPDGQQIAFDSTLEGNFDIYVIRSSGGKPIRLTDEPAVDVAPSWSRDGKWVYFESERSGRMEVWKVPAGGGEAIQVTRNGGGPAQESPDGRSIYCTKGDYGDISLWKMPREGGKENQVLPSVFWRGFCVVADGIYFIAKPDKEGKSSIQFLNAATGKVKTVTSVSGWPTEGLSVSPDGRSLLFSQTESRPTLEIDLMLVENFR